MRSHSFPPQQHARSLKAKFFARVRFRFRRLEPGEQNISATRPRSAARWRMRAACRAQAEELPLFCTTVKPPKAAGAALSGCPSDSAHNLKRASRSSGSPLSLFSPSRMPRRTVALLPRPRHLGTCSAIENENENLWHRACLKNRSAASDTIRGWEDLGVLPRTSVTLL